MCYNSSIANQNVNCFNSFKSTFSTSCKKYYSFLQNNIKTGERYNLSFDWKGKSKDGHIVTIYKENNELTIYDPQNGKHYKNDEIKKEYLNKIKYSATSYGTKFNKGVNLYRIDNLSFNPEFMNDIMRKA